MSVASKIFGLGGVFVAGIFLFASALHWYNTPHPDASQARMVAVGVQALAGLVASAYGYYGYIRAKREFAADSAGAHMQ